MLWDTTLASNVGYMAALLYNQNNVSSMASGVTLQLERECARYTVYCLFRYRFYSIYNQYRIKVTQSLTFALLLLGSRELCEMVGYRVINDESEHTSARYHYEYPSEQFLNMSGT